MSIMIEKHLKDISLYLRDIRNEIVKMNQEKEVLEKDREKTLDKLAKNSFKFDFPSASDVELIERLAGLGNPNPAPPYDIRNGVNAVDQRGATREPK